MNRMSGCFAWSVSLVTLAFWCSGCATGGRKQNEPAARLALSNADVAESEHAYTSIIVEYPGTEAADEAATAVKRLVSQAAMKTTVTNAWAYNWESFVAYFQPFFDAGKITTDDRATLSNIMHGVSVSWSGVFESYTNGVVVVKMKSVPVRWAEFSQRDEDAMRLMGLSAVDNDDRVIWYCPGGKANDVDAPLTFGNAVPAARRTWLGQNYNGSVTVTPRWNNRKAWSLLTPGRQVTFRTVLVGSGIGRVWVGAGPNRGRLLVTWQTEDAELTMPSPKSLAKTSDPTELSKIVMEERDWIARSAALEQITDQSALIKIANADINIDIRSKAIAQITNQTALVKIAIEHKNWRLRREATDKLLDQTVLGVIATKDPEGWVRAAAIQKVTNQALLAQVAVADQDSAVRSAAVEKITDQVALAKVALTDPELAVRSSAVRHMTDQAMLAKLAMPEQPPLIRSLAVSNITDQIVLSKIVAAGGDVNVTCAAVGKVTDQALLAHIASESEDWMVRRAAVANVTDQALLERLALDDQHGWVRQAAVQRLTNQALLAKIAATHQDADLCMAAVCCLTDSALLQQVADAAANPRVQREAQSRLRKYGHKERTTSR